MSFWVFLAQQNSKTSLKKPMKQVSLRQLLGTNHCFNSSLLERGVYTPTSPPKLLFHSWPWCFGDSLNFPNWRLNLKIFKLVDYRWVSLNTFYTNTFIELIIRIHWQQNYIKKSSQWMGFLWQMGFYKVVRFVMNWYLYSDI